MSNHSNRLQLRDSCACNGLICPPGGAVYLIKAIFSLYTLHVIIFYLQTAALDKILLFSLYDEG